MRRSITALTLFASLALVACEDGPSQTYSPQQGVQNGNGSGNPAVGGVSAGFNNLTGGTNVVEICDAPKKAATWANMVKQPIKPPSVAGGIDLAGKPLPDGSGPDWAGLTIEDAEKTLCQSTNLGDEFGDGTLVNAWGENYELWMDYRVSNHKGIFYSVWPGYVGTLDATSPDGTNKYSFPIQSQVQKNGKPMELDWNPGPNSTAGKMTQGNEIYNAIVHTWAPAIESANKAAGNTDCFASGGCVQGAFGDVAYFFIPAMGYGLWIDNQNAPQPTPSIPTRMDQYLTKTMAYSFANVQLKLDATGPIAAAGTLLTSAGDCTLEMGLSFGDFLKKCVQTTGDDAKNKTELNKLLGGLTHSTERFSFDVSGVDVNFSDKNLPDNDVVHDDETPDPTDISSQFDVDQSTLGKLLNDRDASLKRDLHGTGAIYKEYAREVRTQLLALANIPDTSGGDFSKCYVAVGQDPSTFTPAPYCTGMEVMITPAPSTGAKDTVNLGLNSLALNPNYAIGLKLGHQQVTFCLDANGDFKNGYSLCTSGDTFATSFAWVLNYFGNGNVSALPTEAQDVRFYFKAWVNAFLRYNIAGGPAAPVPDLSAAQYAPDPDDLFFDSIGAGQFEIAEYVDRRYATTKQDPTDVEVFADVKNGIFDEYIYSRELYRGEELLYSAVLENQSDGLGQEHTGGLTNLFGSPVLAAGWAPGDSGKRSAYECATQSCTKGACNYAADCAVGGVEQFPPLDANGNTLLDELGRPILLNYEGAFAGNQTVFVLDAANPSVVTAGQTFANIEEIYAKIPRFSNPYDPNSAPLPALQKLVPWLPKQPGVGFPIALSGTLDKFVTTSQMDLSGTTITANIDYDVALDANTHEPLKGGKINLLAVETTDFLGDVFLCQDAATGDLLRARMYTPVANILDWIQAHPGSYQSCGIVIRYSPFGNYADYITALNAGVRLGITQGGGYGRVVDVTLFAPGQ